MTALLYESPTRFSQSMFWKLVIDYYARQGAQAWDKGAVPFRISCNAFIAKAYAGVIAGFLRDLASEKVAGPVTLLELGAGSGQFGFLLVKALQRELGAEGLQQVRYLMTDVAEPNLRAWEGHPKLEALADAGVMQFAQLDVAQPEEARLRSGERLADFIGGRPVVVMANYLLDSLVQDAFRVEDGVLYEEHVALSAPNADHAPEPEGTTDFFDAMRFHREPVKVAWPCYPNSDLDEVLRSHLAALEDASFLFPALALEALDWLRTASGGRLLLIASDKARATPEQLDGHHGIGIAISGAPSSTVNMFAFAEWTRRRGGTVMTPRSPDESFDTYACLTGGAARETARAYAAHMQDFGPAAFWRLAYPLMEAQPDVPLRTLLGLVRLADFEPYVLVRLAPLIAEACTRRGERGVEGVAATLEQCWDRYFPHDGERDVAFAIAEIYRSLGDPQQALSYYERSSELVGAREETFRGMALCLEALGREREAMAQHRKAMAAAQELADARAA